MNIVSEILRYATPAIVDRVASAVGINSSLARMAITYAIPAILGAFASKSATPQGASALFDAVKSTDSNMLGSLDGALGGASKDAFIQNGSSVLGSLLGSGGVSSIVGALTKNAGVSSAAASMLLPVVSQMVLGGLSKNSSGLDASGLGKMLSSQQDNIRAAMPAMSSGDNRPSVPPAPAAAAPGGGLLRWLLPLVALGALGWYFLGNTATTPVATDKTVTAPSAGLTIDGIDVSKTLNDTLANTTTALGTITDAASATAALPKLEESVKAVDGLSGLASKFSPDQKTMIGTLISAGMPALKAAADKALGMNGVGAIAKPVVDGLLSKIEALAK